MMAEGGVVRRRAGDREDEHVNESSTGKKDGKRQVRLTVQRNSGFCVFRISWGSLLKDKTLGFGGGGSAVTKYPSTRDNFSKIPCGCGPGILILEAIFTLSDARSLS